MGFRRRSRGSGCISATLILLSLPGCQLAAQGSIGGTAFNPALSFILDGKFTSYSDAPPQVAGVLQSRGSETAPEGFSLSDTELVASANVDDKFYGFIVVGSELDESETEVELEEAWLQTLALPQGLSVKAGKFFSDIGYHNIRHPHAWDFVNAPLAYDAFLGTTYSDTGVQLRWVAPTALLVEAGVELMSGDGFPAHAADDDAVGGKTLFAHVGGDVGISHSWRAGVSLLSAESAGRESLLGDVAYLFDGETDVTIVDFVWKWARNGNPTERNFTIAAEYLRRDEDGMLMDDQSLGFATAHDEAQSGLYVYGTYQFRPKWRVGVRHGRVELNDALAIAPGFGAAAGDARRSSLMVDWSNSEFSRLRVQIDESDLGGGSTTTFFLQYVMSMGSHGAHAF